MVYSINRFVSDPLTGSNAQTAVDQSAKVIEVMIEITSRINASRDLAEICQQAFQLMDVHFGFKHSMILLADEEAKELRVLQSHGYADSGQGAVVKYGKGIIGMVAKNKRLMRMGNIAQHFLYMSVIKTNMGHEAENVALPGLQNVVSQLAIPLISNDQLIGVFSVESEQIAFFQQQDEQLLNLIGAQMAIAIGNAQHVNLLNQTIELTLEKENLEQLVQARTQEIEAQKAEIEEQNQNITSSIRYAQLIQQSILPDEAEINRHFSDHFVLYQPKDIVSGDFYWMHAQDNKVIFAVADCTGHGVPGAMVSLVGYNGLMRATASHPCLTPSKIINGLQDYVDASFNREQVKDGMDIAVVTFDFDAGILQFSGAFNSVHLNYGSAMMELKGTRRPVGGLDLPNQSFELHEVPLKGLTNIYLTTDGLADQFGGPEGKKLKKRPLIDLIAQNAHLPMKQQGEAIESLFLDWKGEEEQIDDVTVIGLSLAR